MQLQWVLSKPLYMLPPSLHNYHHYYILPHTQYADGGYYVGSVQDQRLYDDAERLQEERHKQELKARRKVDLDLQWT